MGPFPVLLRGEGREGLNTIEKPVELLLELYRNVPLTDPMPVIVACPARLKAFMARLGWRMTTADRLNKPNVIGTGAWDREIGVVVWPAS